MPVSPMGPTSDGGDEVVAVGEGGERYEVLFLPDAMNDELQREGKAPRYYWVPRAVRIARRGEQGDYKFHLIHFVGVNSSDTTVGVKGSREVAGGVLSVTTTCAPPPSVLESAKAELTRRIRGSDRKFWSWRSTVSP